MLFVDPGEATGWSLWNYDPHFPLQRLEFGLIPGGLNGFLDWSEVRLGLLHADVICERFNPALGTADGSKNYEPMYIEGALRAICRALGLSLEFQDVGMKALCGDHVLKRNGLWIHNSEVEWEDARDVNDTQRHALAWALSNDHAPSLSAYWPDE